MNSRPVRQGFQSSDHGVDVDLHELAGSQPDHTREQHGNGVGELARELRDDHSYGQLARDAHACADIASMASRGIKFPRRRALNAAAPTIA